MFLVQCSVDLGIVFVLVRLPSNKDVGLFSVFVSAKYRTNLGLTTALALVLCPIIVSEQDLVVVSRQA